MPTKIICVAGSANTGKSSSIRLLVKTKTRLDKPIGDLIVIVPVRRKRRRYPIGVATQGDTKRHVQDNFKFFAPYGALRAIVCASRGKGSSIAEVHAQAAALGATVVIIPTRKVAAAHQAREHARV